MPSPPLNNLRSLKWQRRILIGLAVVNAIMIWSAPVPIAQLTHLVVVVALALLYATNERLNVLNDSGKQGTILPIVKRTLEVSCLILLHLAGAASITYYAGN